MDTEALVHEIAGQADEFLAGIRSRDEARACIAELLIADHPFLSDADKRTVITGVMRILESEDFFETSPGGAWSEDDSGDEPAD